MTPEPSGTSSPSDKDAILSGPVRDGQNVLLTVNQYRGRDPDGWRGTIIEETSAFRSDVELFYDLHTLVWDEARGQTLDVRNDAVDSNVAYESSHVPELHLTNEFAFDDGETATLTQDVVVGIDTCGLLIQNTADFETASPRTLFSIVNLGIKGHDHETRGAVQEAFVRHADDCDVVVATDGDRYLAYAHEQASTGRRRFDGHRVGVKGKTDGPTRSAWQDIYVENDGQIEDNGGGYGNLDAGVALDVDDASAMWTTAVGFAYSEDDAVEHARRLLDSGYDAEREAFVEAWESWHEGVSSGPTEDDTANYLYELSLTSLKCAQDRCSAMIAGAFKPREMTYRFVWPRDQVIILQALLAAGAEHEALDALDWFRNVQITEDVYDERGINRRGTWWQNYYCTGRGHWRTLQLDQVGGPIYAHWLAWQETGNDAVLAEYYDMSRMAAEFLLDWDNGYGFPDKHQDPWEEIWGHSTEGVAAAIAGLRSMGELAEARGEDDFASQCRERAATWTEHFDSYCFKQDTPYGNHYVTADSPEHPDTPRADERPDAAAFMAYWPWNVVPADSDELVATVELAADTAWRAADTPCLGRYPGDYYTPSGTPEDGGWPLCEAYADVARWGTGVDRDAVETYVFEHAPQWTTAAGLLPERVDGVGDVHWNSNLQWSQAMYVLLVESAVRGEPFGFAPDG